MCFTRDRFVAVLLAVAVLSAGLFAPAAAASPPAGWLQPAVKIKSAPSGGGGHNTPPSAPDTRSTGQAPP